MSLTTASTKCMDEKKGQEQTKSAWFQFLKSVMTFKGDLTSLTAPPFLLAPTSIIEYSAYWAEHPKLFVAPALEADPEARALKVLQWFLSTLREQHSSKDENGKRKKLKPLNPFLGETFLGRWMDDSVGVTELISEQVSHHPPKTAYKIFNKGHGISLEGHVAPKAYFSTTINIERKGHGVLHIDRHNEDHLITMPKVHVEGIMTFQIAPELSGVSYIHSSSGYVSRVEYASKGWLLKGKSNSFVATLAKTSEPSKPLYTLEGTWNKAYTIKKGGEKSKVTANVDLSGLRRTPLTVAPLDQQHPLESRRAWHAVATAIDANDIMAVGREKSAIENAQRALRREEKADGRVWPRRFFREVRISEDPVLARFADDAALQRSEGNNDDDNNECMSWKFDEDKYRRTLQNAAEGVKSPTHTRFDSGIGLIDDEILVGA
ncbi:oxysterol binding protein [Apiospora aurea]|uniref:Oxysterol binding protein n=1 Tax=Apiospora aurea TaxID=335848 RepID=A0ABR1QNG9_9PEZI